MSFEITLDDQTIRDLIVTAFEGGINYWCKAGQLIDGNGQKMSDTEFCENSDFPLSGKVIIVPDEYDADPDAPESYTINQEAVEQGLQTMRNKYPHHFSNLFTEAAWDAETADVFIQCCVFGELVFC